MTEKQYTVNDIISLIDRIDKGESIRICTAIFSKHRTFNFDGHRMRIGFIAEGRITKFKNRIELKKELYKHLI